jgi:hypothetical protein
MGGADGLIFETHTWNSWAVLDDCQRVEARDCPMSSCAAPAGSPCRTAKGKVAVQYHTARFAPRAPGTVIRPGRLLLIMRWRTAGAWCPPGRAPDAGQASGARAARPAAGQPCAARVQHGLTQAELAA